MRKERSHSRKINGSYICTYTSVLLLPLGSSENGEIGRDISFVLWKQAVIRAYLLKTLAMALSQIGCAVSPVS